MGWYRVVKTIKGHRYLYEQRTWREGKHVRTESRYIGPHAATGRGATFRDSSEELEPLAAEARKYKSAEEFVKAKTNAFHGTDAEFEVFDQSKAGSKGILYGKGTYLTNSRDIAKFHGKNIKEVYVDKS